MHGRPFCMVLYFPSSLSLTCLWRYVLSFGYFECVFIHFTFIFIAYFVYDFIMNTDLIIWWMRSFQFTYRVRCGRSVFPGADSAATGQSKWLTAHSGTSNNWCRQTTHSAQRRLVARPWRHGTWLRSSLHTDPFTLLSYLHQTVLSYSVFYRFYRFPF